ncbi:hypothetical protein TPAU25S_04302 [Tsukamurella paurometabola]|uniref:ApeA N-terminal domain-containing protein n=1 Tax=Tsukamurella paurometabola (strain ATCC 8368 / DSM 20162 / CCUG 35730 / CIP 100753 / JCM 10117 / KCTC 9821 / NBRC 16120 / NCIMB 702349 / NCTC 13040) TaxID=521096 RepID=D5UR95_TSUPD|nr:hypothetical protein [Tsukamurella paurometabola]ADG79084.1 conserved hypothetical protein [Tsukamurella paurometabola DSM 20162]SUP34021.1 Uncharacterised protein [Tsukamurella paurometabola]
MTDEHWPLDQLGHFACGSGIHVEASCCGASFATRIGGFVAKIQFPVLSTPWQRAKLEAPSSFAVDPAIPLADEREPHQEWGVVSQWRTQVGASEQEPVSVRVQRLGFTIVDRFHEREGIAQIHKDTPAVLDRWWDLFCAWVSILSTQDPRDHLRLQGAARRDPVWMWVGGGKERRGQTVSSDAIRWDRTGTPLDPATVETCMYLAGTEESPPTEWLFVRDARSAVAAGDYRRAVIDAGTAAELAITELLDQHLSAVEEAVAEALMSRSRALEQRSKLMKELGAGFIPDGFAGTLQRPRNAAAHSGQAPTLEVAQGAIAVAVALLEQSTPLLALVPAELASE